MGRTHGFLGKYIPTTHTQDMESCTKFLLYYKIHSQRAQRLTDNVIAGVKPLSQKDFIGLILCFFHRDGKMHPYSAGLTRLDRARETEGTDGLKAGRRGKSEQLSCVTKASTIVWGSLGIPDSKCRREIILLHL